jgi:chromosome partitioning protein
MILTVGNIKGGVGKTTTALNITIALALCGEDVLLIDGDEQATAATFTDLRTTKRQEAARSQGRTEEEVKSIGPGYTCARLQGAAIKTQVRQMAPKYDHIVIDVGGRDTGGLRSALVVSDLLLMPVEPGSFEVWATADTLEVVTEARELNEKLRALIVINKADPQGNDNAETEAYFVDKEGVEIAPHYLTRRKVYRNAQAEGLSVFEIEDKAQREAIEKARADFASLTSFHFDGLMQQPEPQKVANA